ncbi:MAG: transposase family protein [Planctomycetaceae bacterium]
MECPREKDRCSGCGSRDVIRRGSRQRQVVAPPLALQTTKLLINVPRLECRNCGRVLQAATPNGVPGCNYTRAFARLVVSRRPMMTINGLRWMLLKHSDNLDPERNEAQRLQEDLAQIWTQGSRTSGEIQILCLNTCNTQRAVFDVEPFLFPRCR